MRAKEFIIEAEPKVLPIIPDNMPFGANQFKDPTGTFKGGGMSTPPPAAKQTTTPSAKAPTASTTTASTPTTVQPKGPATQNIIAPALIGRPKPEDVTHAYRTMTPAEFQHAQTTGHFTPKDPSKDNRKWWTAHTANPRGIGGLVKSSEPYPAAQVRVPIGKVPSDTAVNTNHAEYWNREIGAWTPVIAPDIKEQQLDELSFLGSECTKDCSGHRAGYEWSKRKGLRQANSWSPSFNKGAGLAVAGK